MIPLRPLRLGGERGYFLSPPSPHSYPPILAVFWQSQVIE